MHTLELDDTTYERLMKYAEQAGKPPSQWLQELIAQLRPVGLTKDKGVPLPDALIREGRDAAEDEGLLLSDAFFESLENIEKPRSLLELIGKGKGCFKSAAEIDAFIREERDAWEK